MKIKKITDLPIGELGEENYVVADIDGEVKKVRTEDIGGGGGGGLPPVTGSGKALVSVDGHWKQQEGFPYDEGETVTTLFDETFTGFTRGMGEEYHYLYPIDNSDPDNENNVVIGGATYYYVDNNVYDYTSIGACTVRDQDGNVDYPHLPSTLVFVESGEVKKVTIPYSIERYDPETGDPIDPLIGTLYGIYAPTDGAQDADGNTFPAAGFYCTVNGDLSDSFAGVYSIDLISLEPTDEWVSEHSVDAPLPYPEDVRNYRVYVDGESPEDGYFDSDAYINFEGGYVYTEDDGEGNYKAKCNLYADSYETAPDSISIKLEEVVSGLHPINAKYIKGGAELEKAVETNGIGWYRNGWEQKIDGETVELIAGESNFTGFQAITLTWGTMFGARVIVELNGVEYDEVMSEDETQHPCVGNKHLAFDDEPDTGEPFFILANFDSNSDYWYIEESGEYTISLSIEGKEKIEIDPDYIPWDSMPSDAIPWYDAPVGTGLPEPPYEDGTYILQATETDGEMEYAWQSASQSGVKVIAEFEVDWDSGSGDPTTEMEYTASCNMTAQEIYDAALSGQNVVVRVKTESGFDELHLMRVGDQEAETNEFEVGFQQIITFHEIHGADVIKTPDGDDYFVYIESRQ